MTRAVAKKEETALVTAVDFEQYAGAGFEEADKDSYAIPFLVILQKLSPQLEPTDGKYIEGAKAGEIFNTVLEKVVADVGVIPCHFRRTFLEFVKREEGGGFVAEHSLEDGLELMKTTEKDDKNRDVLPNGHTLSDTRNHFLLVVKPDGTTEPAVLGMTSTQTGKSKKWMSRMNNLRLKGKKGNMFNPPHFSHRYPLTTVLESNDKGNWYGWKIGDGVLVEDEGAVSAAVIFRDAIMSGEAQVAHESMDNSSEGLPEENF